MVRYEPAAKQPTATACQPGTRALLFAVRAAWPELAGFPSAYGCWNPRRIKGSSSWSLHAEGRAIDVHVPANMKNLGWELGCELSNRRQVYGVQRVIWDGHIWSIEQPRGWRELLASTKDKHRDHLHIEQWWADALKPSAVQATYENELKAARVKTGS